MTKAQIIELQQRIGATPDGFWGPKSIAAVQKHLRALMPSPNPWPKDDPAALLKFYGKPGTGHTTLKLPFPMNLYGDTTDKVDTVTVHEKCADSLRRVLVDLYDRYYKDAGIMKAASAYFGIYNNRPKRGGINKSLHAYAAAIDLDANRNTFKASWPVEATMPIEIMECFAREGWLPAGAFWGYDSMHFQATR